MRIIYTKVYNKKMEKLLTVKERNQAEEEIAKHPEIWPLIKGGCGIRKARARKGNVGKSGGIRIILLFH